MTKHTWERCFWYRKRFITILIGNDDIFFLIYLSDFEKDKWDSKDGGGIAVGIRELEIGKHWSNESPNDNEVDLLREIQPENGRIVYGNNMNPRFVHKPIKMSDDANNKNINRYTFLVTIKLEKKY